MDRFRVFRAAGTIGLAWFPDARVIPRDILLRLGEASRRKPDPYAPSTLIVDDEEPLRTLFRRLIEDLGYLVYEAESGRAAIRTLEDRFIDLMVLDLSMPDQDGFDTLRYARSAWPDLKVVVTSGLMGGSLLQIAAALGASATLDKILAPQLLVPTVCRVLGS